MFKTIFTSVIFLWGSSLFAETGLQCTKDDRPADGSFNELTLKESKNLKGAFDVTFRTISSWTRETKNYVLARDLTCIESKTEPRLKSCFREKTDLESRDSTLFSTLVTRQYVAQDINGGPTDIRRQLLEIEVRSPLTKNEESVGQEKFEFSLKDCKVLE